jgi:GTP-binding protein
MRNVAIIAHVDHGKTSLVDAMLRQTDVFHARQAVGERILDTGELERERGITILSKNAAIRRDGVKVNLVDTPGHADFGGEVERVLNMVDGVLLLVDAVEGPMPQTRFVLGKALRMGHRAVVVVNKMDRPTSRPDHALNATFDLFVELGATDSQADFQVVYTRALAGQASLDPKDAGADLGPLFDAILDLPGPAVESQGPLQILVTTVDHDDYKGRIVVGRVRAGTVQRGQDVVLLAPGSEPRMGRVAELFVFENLGRLAVDSADAGDIVAIAGLEDAAIGETVTDPLDPRPLEPIAVEAPTVRMAFLVNSSPFAGRDGKYVTSRPLRDRLQRELARNVALRVEDTDSPDRFLVSGRGELHLAILVETMRREGYELAVGNPEVIVREIDGQRYEPFEDAYITVAETYMGPCVETLGRRRGQMVTMQRADEGSVHLHYLLPTRGLLGFRSAFLSMTRGTGVLNSLFHGYEPWAGDIEGRETGSMVAHDSGVTTSYALDLAQQHGALFVGPAVEVYAGQIVGTHPRAFDMVFNVCRKKHVTNHRRSGAEDAIMLSPPTVLTVDEAIEFIAPDELVEVTPKAIRLRKRELVAEKRQKVVRQAKAGRDTAA